MSGGFLDIVSEKLDLDNGRVEEEVNAYLVDLAGRIRSEPYRIDGFGTFSWEDGEIVFEPEPALSQAVNFRYEGLPALELPRALEDVSGFSHPDEADASRASGASPSQEVTGAPEELSVSDVPPDSDAAIASDAPVESDTAVESREDQLEEALPERPTWQPVIPSTPPGRVPDETARESADTHGPSGAEGPESEGGTPLHEQTDVPPHAPGRKPSRGAETSEADASTRRVFPIVATFVIVVAIIAGAVYLFQPSEPAEVTGPALADTDQPAPAETPRRPEAEVAPAETAEDVQDDAEAQPPENPPAQSQTQEVDAQASARDAAESSAESPFASDFDRTATGYTLMVGSIDSAIRSDAAAAASEAMARYADLGLPRAILSYEGDGSVRYRLALGRFDTIEDAQQEMARLGNRIPGDTWVWRIR
jgi:hypothetical protein